MCIIIIIMVCGFTFLLGSAGILKSVTQEDLLKFTHYMLEKIVKLIKEYSEKVHYQPHVCTIDHTHLPLPQNGPQIESITIILDAEKLSFQRHYYWPGIQLSRQVL